MVFVRRYRRGNSTYLAEVESYREGGKIKQRFVRYVGREADGRTILSCSVSEAEVTGVRIYGPLLLLNAVAEKIGLSKLLGGYGDYLLSLAYAHCVEPDSLKKIVGWYQRTDINQLLDIKDVTYQKLLDALDSVSDLNGVAVQQKIFRSISREFALARDGFFYDLTNVYFYGLSCPLAKKGHNKDGINRPQIQIGLAVTRKEGIPVFHKVFAGNIFDSKTLPDILSAFKEHDIHEPFLIWDRGVSSQLNLEEAKQAGFEAICGLSLNDNLKKIADETVKEKFASVQNRVRLQNSTFYAKKMAYPHGIVQGWLVVCFNEKQKQETKERRYDEIDEAIEQIKKKKPVSKEGIKKYLDGTKILPEKLSEAEKYDGISTLFTTKDLPMEEIVKAYFEKDRVEKAFRCMKSILEVDKIRFWLSERVEAHVFVCYIAYLLLSMLDFMLKAKPKTSDLNAITALDLMESMYRVHMQDPKTKTRIVKTVTLTNQQKDILRVIDKKLLKCSEQKTL